MLVNFNAASAYHAIRILPENFFSVLSTGSAAPGRAQYAVLISNSKVELLMVPYLLIFSLCRSWSLNVLGTSTRLDRGDPDWKFRVVIHPRVYMYLRQELDCLLMADATNSEETYYCV